mgnify:CR=1 FL=1
MSSYLELLNLTREPFSNSPDPDAYYRTPTHEDCLNRLEIAIRLRRGLNVVLGEVGTGKSTLCRCLLRSLNEQSGIDVFLLLDAGFEDADEFVRHLCELFAGQRPPEGVARRECISVIQNRVFDKALEQNRNLVLFIDEGQKLSPAALEVLRELLNFETNTEKLLQIVIFGQPELAQIIEGMPNFKDRIKRVPVSEAALHAREHPACAPPVAAGGRAEGGTAVFAREPHRPAPGQQGEAPPAYAPRASDAACPACGQPYNRNRPYGVGAGGP